MKKLVVAAGLIAMFNMAVAGAEHEVTSGEVNVSAIVAETLQVGLKNVEFGIIPSNGDAKTTPDTVGEINIKGSAGTNVLITIEANGQEYKIGEENSISLFNSENISSVSYSPKFYVNGEGLTTNKVELLNGEAKVEVAGDAYVVSEGAQPGRYSTDLTVKVQYDY